MNTEPGANDDTLSLTQAAELLHIGFKAMKELVDTGEVPALSCNQKHCVLLREDVITYVREQGRKQASTRRARRTPSSVTPSSTPATNARGRRKVVKPNLDPYELTIGAQPGSNRAGSRTGPTG